MSGADVFVSQVAPVAGVIITELLVLGPMYAVLEARRNGRLGSLDPVLFSMTLPQSVIWVVYGALLNNIYYFLGSIGGVFVGVFYLMTVMQLAPSKSQCRKMEVFLFVQIFVISIIGVVGFYDKEVATQAAGLDSMLSSISLYATPFLNLRNMVINKDASSINRGFLFMQLVSGAMWTSYTFFEFDIWVLVPSLMGLFFGIVQLSLVVVYRKPRSQFPAGAQDMPLMNAVEGCYRPPICYRSKSSESMTATETPASVTEPAAAGAPDAPAAAAGPLGEDAAEAISKAEISVPQEYFEAPTAPEMPSFSTPLEMNAPSSTAAANDHVAAPPASGDFSRSLDLV
ncbi:Bidirectional sugar transporter SWEET11 [Hondaea fermentalgiana]|uniref:Bidirectional sugar transporter SWEET11 n=1 Tax=Hondaea fermentalgiana TaxID=2315210 RepID=A0A2R5GWR8_9STRA|nr:Bidirectional sugar transporter SWEET11 [Hondaea fermentalgiana]|eukprot:GBG34218.1 Bidirectional sugar transporter SWEET11 [Hondaea fermentalgiana]